MNDEPDRPKRDPDENPREQTSPPPTLDEVLDRAGRRSGGALSFEAAVRILRKDRRSH